MMMALRFGMGSLRCGGSRCVSSGVRFMSSSREGIFHGIEDAYDLETRLPALWAYAVGHVGGGADNLPDGWLRYVVPTEDTNRSRWPVHPDWYVIQGAFEPLQVVESDYERDEREREDLLQQVDAELSVRPLAPTLMKPAASCWKKV